MKPNATKSFSFISWDIFLGASFEATRCRRDAKRHNDAPVTSRRAKRSRAMTLADARDGDAAFEANRVAGNAAYDRERFVEATARYTECVEALEKRLGSAEGEGTARRACAIRANRAACFVKRGKHALAMEDASWVIARPLEAGAGILAKALYRRARAHEGVGDVEAALADLRAAEKIDPHDALIQSALNNFTSVFHIAVVLDRASPEVLARQPAWRNFKPETRP